MAVSEKKIELLYFGYPGRAASSRMALRYAKIPFDNNHPSNWGEVKPTTPWGSLPVLTVDGQKVAQTRAVTRYCCKIAGLYPEDAFQAALVDSTHCVVEDILTAVIKSTKGIDRKENEAEWNAARVAVCSKGGAAYTLTSKLDSFVEEHGKNGFAVGESLSLADLVIACYSSNLLSGFFDAVPLDWMNDFSNLNAVRSNVFNQPTIKEYYTNLDLAEAQKLKKFAPWEVIGRVLEE